MVNTHLPTYLLTYLSLSLSILSLSPFSEQDVVGKGRLPLICKYHIQRKVSPPSTSKDGTTNKYQCKVESPKKSKLPARKKTRVKKKSPNKGTSSPGSKKKDTPKQKVLSKTAERDRILDMVLSASKSSPTKAQEDQPKAHSSGDTNSIALEDTTEDFTSIHDNLNNDSVLHNPSSRSPVEQSPSSSECRNMLSDSFSFKSPGSSSSFKYPSPPNSFGSPASSVSFPSHDSPPDHIQGHPYPPFHPVQYSPILPPPFQRSVTWPQPQQVQH